MKRKKPVFKIISYGEFSKWDQKSKEIPKILDITTEIESEAGTEFGYVLEIKQGKGETIEFRIDHPPFEDESGDMAPPFAGEQLIRTNNYLFYLGDCIWDPPEDKFGEWKLTVFYKGKVAAQKIFSLKKKNN
jgi:hypothetical protein